MQDYDLFQKTSPFTPGNPVPVELFIGRKEKIDEVIRYIRQISAGKQENIFLSGERGIGKSSFASFIRHLVGSRYNILGLHVFLGKVSTLDDMICLLFNQLLEETKEQTWYEKIKKFLGNHIKEVGLYGISVKFSPTEHDLKELVGKFPEAIHRLLEEIKDEKKGLFIVLDDINGLADNLEFANWYKSFVDEVATHYKNFPVLIMLVGLPEKRDSLSNKQPSLTRIFRIIEIEKLRNEEVENFFNKTFKKADIKNVTEEAMTILVTYSSGLPTLMHEIGDATFWADNDGVVDGGDAVKGVLDATQNIGRKYLDPKVYRTIRSERYRSILRKLGKIQISRYFKKKDVLQKLTENEKKVFHNFLRRLIELGIIESDFERGPGAYKFVNAIYPVYIWMESHGQKEK